MENEEYLEVEKLPLSVLDYIIMVVGAANDYNYLIKKNRYVLDNEVTGIKALPSYFTVMFILYMISLKNPYIKELFAFRKSRRYGIMSDPFIDALNSVYKKYPLPYTWYAHHYNKLESEFLFHDDIKKMAAFNLGSRPFTFLSVRKKEILPQQIYGKEKSVGNKIDVLLTLPRFYYNYYHSIINKDKATTNKMNINFQIPEENIRMIMKETGLSIERIKEIMKGDIERKKPMSVDEVEEFFLKSIAIRYKRRKPRGIYLLRNGVARFREIVFHQSNIPSNNDILNMDTFHLDGKKIGFKDMVDLDNKPYLLKKSFMDRIDKYYRKNSFIKYIEVYAALFGNHEHTAYYVLGKYLLDWKNKNTFSKYEKLPQRYISANEYRFQTYFK